MHFALILSGSRRTTNTLHRRTQERKALLTAAHHIHALSGRQTKAEMDSNFFHFDDDNDDDNNKNDHTTTTTTTTTTTSMPDSRSHKKKLITRPNRNDVLCGRG